MSGTFPATPAPNRLRLRSVHQTRVSESHSLQINTRTGNAHRWVLILSWAPGERSDHDPISAFLDAQQGRHDTFQLVLPNPLYSPRGTGAVGSPSPFVDAEQQSPSGETQTGRTILTRGWVPSATIFCAGDFVKFASHAKVYRVTQDTNADSQGRATLLLNTPVFQALAHGDAIITHNIPFTVSNASDDIGLGVAPAQIFDLDEVTLVERF